jgi:hypothetical protein
LKGNYLQRRIFGGDNIEFYFPKCNENRTNIRCWVFVRPAAVGERSSICDERLRSTRFSRIKLQNDGTHDSRFPSRKKVGFMGVIKDTRIQYPRIKRRIRREPRLVLIRRIMKSYFQSQDYHPTRQSWSRAKSRRIIYNVAQENTHLVRDSSRMNKSSKDHFVSCPCTELMLPHQQNT